jgi:hypothetical protein
MCNISDASLLLKNVYMPTVLRTFAIKIRTNFQLSDGLRENSDFSSEKRAEAKVFLNFCSGSTCQILKLHVRIDSVGKSGDGTRSLIFYFYGMHKGKSDGTCWYLIRLVPTGQLWHRGQMVGGAPLWSECLREGLLLKQGIAPGG